jgi:periplasmic divalent cation tolerance protein
MLRAYSRAQPVDLSPLAPSSAGLTGRPCRAMLAWQAPNRRNALPEYLQVLTAAGSEEEAERISAALVARRLAACVQVVGPISSRYRWRGEVETAREWLCLAKTEAARYAELEAAIRELHSYEEPEIVAVPIVAGSAGYLAWLGESINP